MKFALLVMFFGLFAIHAKAQDTITMTNGNEVKAKVLEVGTDEIKYKKFGFEDGPTYSVKKSEVFMIHYQNGSKDVFGLNNNSAPANNTHSTNQPANDYVQTQSSQPSTADDYTRGMKDADRYYGTSSNPAAIGTLITASLLSPLFGLIPAIACSATCPKNQNLHLRDANMLNNNNYMMGYREEAWKIKRRKVWIDYGIGSAVSIILVLLLNHN